MSKRFGFGFAQIYYLMTGYSANVQTQSHNESAMWIANREEQRWFVNVEPVLGSEQHLYLLQEQLKSTG